MPACSGPVEQKKGIKETMKAIRQIVIVSIIGMALAHNALGAVILTDDFNRATLGTSWTSIRLSDNSTNSAYFGITANRLANSGWAGQDWTLNTDYQLFSNPHSTEMVQINVINNDDGAGLTLHANGIDGYVMRYYATAGLMQILEYQAGGWSGAGIQTAVSLSTTDTYTLRGMTDNAGHLHFEIWSTLSGNPDSLLYALNFVDPTPFTGGYAGAYNSASISLWDNFSISGFVPEPSTTGLLLVGVGTWWLRRKQTA
jgi:hypothetical protein